MRVLGTGKIKGEENYPAAFSSLLNGICVAQSQEPDNSVPSWGKVSSWQRGNL